MLCIQASEVTQLGPGDDTTFTDVDIFMWALVGLPHLQPQFLPKIGRPGEGMGYSYVALF